MRVEDPIRAYLSSQTQGFPVSWQQQFDGGGIKSNSMIEPADAMSLVDSTNNEHSHQNLHIRYQCGIARKQRLHSVRAVGNHDQVYPGSRNIHARKRFANLVHLRHDNAVPKGRGFDNECDSSVLAPVYRFPSASAQSAAINEMSGVKSTRYLANNSR